jgi:hypothetical protein
MIQLYKTALYTLRHQVSYPIIFTFFAGEEPHNKIYIQKLKNVKLKKIENDELRRHKITAASQESYFKGTQD